MFECRMNSKIEERIIKQIKVSAELEGISDVTTDEARLALINALVPLEGVTVLNVDDTLDDVIVILVDDETIHKSFDKETFMELYENEIVQTVQWLRNLEINKKKRRRFVDYRYDPNRWTQIMLINKDMMERIVNEIATEANVSYDDAYYGLLNEQLTDSIDGPCVTDEPMDDIRIVNGHRDRTFRIYTEFSFMVEYKDRVLRRLANQ